MKPLHFLEYLIFRLIGRVVRSLPLKKGQVLGGWLGEFVYSKLGFRRRVTLENLRNAFPDSDAAGLDMIARKAFRSVGIALFELLWFPRFNTQHIRQMLVVENPGLLLEARSRGKGTILLTAHFGNWELLAQSALAATGFPVWIIVKPQANDLVDRTVNRWRTMLGNKVIPMGVSVREILRALHDGQFVGIVADQTAPMESVAVEFFGRSVPTFEGPAVFSLKTGAPILFGVAVRQADGTYRARFVEVSSGDLDGYNQENVTELTKRHVQMTEAMIRQYPDQWMWMHKRWKHVPSRTPEKADAGTE